MCSLFVFIVNRLSILQRVLNCDRYLTRHLLEQDEVVFIKSIVRTPGECQNTNHAIAAYERKNTPRSEALLDHLLINKLAVRIPISFRILAELFEAIDPDALGLPKYLTRDRTIHRHQRSLAEASSPVGIVQVSDAQLAALGVGQQQGGRLTLHYPE